MDDLKPTDSPTQKTTTQEPVGQVGGQEPTPQPTPPKAAPTAPTVPPTTEPKKPPESPPQIVPTQTTTTEMPGEKPKLSGRFPKAPKKKIIAGIATLLLVVLGGISVATAWKLRQVEKVTPEEAEAWVGDHCTTDCDIVIGPGNLTFEAAGHGFRWHCLSPSDCELNGSEVKKVDIYVPFPAGATVKEAYAIWSGEGCHSPADGDCTAENDANIRINGQNTPAIKSFVAQNPEYPTNTQAANIAKLRAASIPSPSGGKLKFTVDRIDDFYAHGHGVSIIVIYEKQGVGYNKIVLKLWGEWLYLACAPHDTRTAECGGPGTRSKVMTIILSDFDATKPNVNKFAWFAGEGEILARDTSKKERACMDEDKEGNSRLRPSHLYYQVPGRNWTMLSPTDSPPAPAPWFACPMDPGGWWVSRVTGVNMPQISLTGNYIKFAVDSAYAAGEPQYEGESYTFAGVVAQYPVVEPTPTPQAKPSCLSLATNPAVLPWPQVTDLDVDDILTLTCDGKGEEEQAVNHYEYRRRLYITGASGWGDWEQIGSKPANNPSLNYKILYTGAKKFQCRVCLTSDSSNCTVWGRADTTSDSELVCTIFFRILGPTPTPTPTPTPPPGCWDTCTPGTCTQGLECQKDVSGTYRCVNPECPSEQTCVCPLLICQDLTTDADISALKEGDEIKLTCTGSSGVDHPINHVEFRAQIDGGSWESLGTADAKEPEVSYTIPQTGNYRIECRVCTSTDDSTCTEWGKAGVAIP